MIEVNGLLRFPLATVPRGNYAVFPIKDGRFFKGASKVSIDYTDQPNLYHKESVTTITAQELRLSKILSVNAIPCEIAGYRTESVWLVNKEVFSDKIELGAKTLAALEQDSIQVMFQIKGIKA